VNNFLTLLFAFCLSPLAEAKAVDSSTNTCRAMSMSELQKEMNGQGQKKIVFFASWCSSCAEKMKANDQNGTIFVAAFDSLERAQEVIDVLNIKQRCILDAGIAQAMDVHSLPAERSIKF